VVAIGVAGVWLACLLLVYVYIGFPALIAAAGRVLNRRVQRANITPPMTLVIAAYNEEQCIAERLDNALASDYPKHALEIIVASDGSTDGTDAIVAGYADRGVRLLRLPRRGKIYALSDAVYYARGHVLVFSDANTMVEPGALRAIARNFADDSVGGVVGCTGYRLESGSESSSRGESLYWRYDTWLKELESRTGSVVSAHGGLYAIRKGYYREPEETAVTDDFIISTSVIALGSRLVFERDARAWEFAVPSSAREFRRRIRLMTRGLRGVAARRPLLNPFHYGFYSVVLFTHKVLRRLTPVALLLLFVSSLLASLAHPAYAALAAGQTLFYAAAVAGYLSRARTIGQLKLLYVPFFYCMANLAALLALLNFARGERIVSWQPQRHATLT